MPNALSPDGPAPRMSTFDTSIIPLEERAWRGILGHVLAVGDEAETTYLEAKSSLPMGEKATSAKIAKFLLGVANRPPRQAAKHFHGYAVLVIGAQKDHAPGVPRGTEAHELEDQLRPYLGPQFPPFEFGRVGVDDDHEVLFVIAQPPQEGQTIFPCHKSYQGKDRSDSLEDGAIYVRGTSNTRPARYGEVLALVERARGGGKPPITLEVEVLGHIHRLGRVDEILERPYEYADEQFVKEPEPEKKHSSIPTSSQLGSSIFGAKPLSVEGREKALAAWRSKKSEHIAKGREHFLGVGLSGIGIRVISRDRFVAKPHLALTFHGCESFDHLDPDDADFEKVVEPVLRTQHPFGSPLDSSALRIYRQGYPIKWENRGDDVEVMLTPESFRPNVPWTSDQDDFVVVARDPEARWIKVSWALTEDGNDDVVNGELRVPTENIVDAADLLRSTFFDES